jgi:hypothetical protein
LPGDPPLPLAAFSLASRSRLAARFGFATLILLISGRTGGGGSFLLSPRRQSQTQKYYVCFWILFQPPKLTTLDWRFRLFSFVEGSATQGV